MESRIVRVRECDFSTCLTRTQPRKSVISSFRRFIEYTDWDKRILAYEKWVNGLCWGSVAFSMACLLPAIVHIIQK